MKPLTLPFAKLLTQAADRLYSTPVWLGEALSSEPLRTLHVLSTNPQAFGTLRPNIDPEHQRERLNHLLTAAKAFAVSQRKLVVDASQQAELALPEPPPCQS